MVVAPALLGALRGISLDLPLDYRKQVQPIIRVLAALGSHHAWLRPQALALVEEPWLTAGGRAAYLMQLTAGGKYEDWAVAINDLFVNGSDTAKWGAIEALRGFAQPLGESAEPRMDPQTLCAAIPQNLYYHLDTTLRWAVYELTVEYGGEPGRQMMINLMSDTNCPDRPGVLSFLCHEGKLNGQDCLPLIHGEDVDMREAAIDGLGHLARFDPANLELLRSLLRSEPDAEVRRLVVKGLVTSDADVLDDLKFAVGDVDATVQLEAVRQIGVLREPQPELLAELARNPRLNSSTRSQAYDEWLLDAPNAEVVKIFDSMTKDSDPEIHEQGYLWKGAMALAQGDADAISSWKDLPIPTTLLEKADVLSKGLADSAVGSMIASTFDGTIHGEVEKRIQDELARLRDPLFQQQIAQHDNLMALSGDSGMRSILLERKFAVSKRLLAFLDSK